MTPKLRAQLDWIEDWLLDPDGGKELATVLSALRGPDDEKVLPPDLYPEGRSTKNLTIHIRRLAFPRMAALEDRRAGYPSTFKGEWQNPPGWLMTNPASISKRWPFFSTVWREYSRHFLHHIWHAQNVLE